MAPALEIGRLAARYRLPARAREDRERLDRVLGALLLDGSLEAAVGAAGATPGVEICVRRIHVPVRVRLSQSDAALGAAWSRAIADGIAAAVEDGHPDVVVYESRVQALVDLSACVAHEDLTRAWAWRQLGLWEPPAAGGAAAGAALARALASEPAAVVGVLRALARRGELERVIDAVEDEGWTTLAAAALYAADAGDVLAVRWLEGQPPREGAAAFSGADGAGPGSAGPFRASAASHAADEPARRRAGSVLGRSAIAAGGRARAAARPGLRRALAVLSTLEAEPAAARDGATAIPLLEAVEERLATGTADRAPEMLAENGSTSEAHAAPRPDGSEPADRPPEMLAEDGSASEAHAAPRPDGSEHPADRSPAKTPGGDTDGERRLPDVRDRGHTRAGGLLFLLNVVDELELADELAADTALGARPLRWTLYALAAELAAVAARDPAALAFAGLGPEAEPPSARAAPPSDDERAAIARARASVVARLRERLDPEGEDAADDEDLLEQVCARSGEIVADPGWIEVRLSLDEASIGIRRAGLDLDPGWLPWLGVVVRYVYD